MNHTVVPTCNSIDFFTLSRPRCYFINTSSNYAHLQNTGCILDHTVRSPTPRRGHRTTSEHFSFPPLFFLFLNQNSSLFLHLFFFCFSRLFSTITLTRKFLTYTLKCARGHFFFKLHFFLLLYEMGESVKKRIGIFINIYTLARG